MSLFRDLGRRAEKLKKQATNAAEGQAEYECADCGKAIFTERETCPECGSEAVASRESGASDEDVNRSEPTDESEPTGEDATGEDATDTESATDDT